MTLFTFNQGHDPMTPDRPCAPTAQPGNTLLKSALVDFVDDLTAGDGQLYS